MDPSQISAFVASVLHISAHVDACGRGFISLATALANVPHFAAQARPETINDEFDRFKIWAGNIAAHRKGRRSLEYRLRDAAHLKVETHNLLQALQDSLANALAIVNGERTPWDELSDSDSDSESGSVPSGFAGDTSFQSDTELKQLSTSIKNTVTCLFRLSMAIRDPAPNSQSRSFITVDKSYFETHDILHVQSKFPEANKILTERLGRAISGRRQYLTYREEHHQKLVKNVEKIGHEEPRTERTNNSTEASPMLVTSGNVNSVLDDGEDTVSQTSYATSVNATIRAPPLPKEAREKKHFECPLCYMIVAIHTTAGWKQHVYRDLHPYCCTYEHCTTADRLYDSRGSWFIHELAHRRSWQCVEECNESFCSEKDFVAHIQARHPDLAIDNALSALKHTAAKSANLSEQMTCPLCNKGMTLRAMQKHLGHHQEQLALFALPPILDETEDDPRDDDAEAPVDVEKWQDDELSDVSDTADAGDDSASDAETEEPPVPWGAIPETRLGKIAAIALHLHTEILPSVMAFTKHPPTAVSIRKFRGDTLSNRIFNEVISKLGVIETEGDHDARMRQLNLIKEAQDLMNDLEGVLSWRVCDVPGCGQTFSSEHDLRAHQTEKHAEPNSALEAALNSDNLVRSIGELPQAISSTLNVSSTQEATNAALDFFAASSRNSRKLESDQMPDIDWVKRPGIDWVKRPDIDWVDWDRVFPPQNPNEASFDVNRDSQDQGTPSFPKQAIEPIQLEASSSAPYFTPEDDKLLIELKEKRNLSWKQIAGFFLEHRPRILQDRYFTKLRTNPTPIRDASNIQPIVPTREEEGDTGIIKCICGYASDDGNTVLCEICNTWQHIICYYESAKDVPDTHYCASCVFKDVDRKGAAEKQRLLRELRGMGEGQVPIVAAKSYKKKGKEPLESVSLNLAEGITLKSGVSQTDFSRELLETTKAITQIDRGIRNEYEVEARLKERVVRQLEDNSSQEDGEEEDVAVEFRAQGITPSELFKLEETMSQREELIKKKMELKYLEDEEERGKEETRIEVEEDCLSKEWRRQIKFGAQTREDGDGHHQKREVELAGGESSIRVYPSNPSGASAMAIPRSQEVSPPLPPPHYIGESSEGQGRDWEWGLVTQPTSNAQGLDGRTDIFDGSRVQLKIPESALSCPPRNSSASGGSTIEVYPCKYCLFTSTSEITWRQHMERNHVREDTRHRSNEQDKVHTISDTEQISIPAEYDVDESFDENREEMTRQAWKSLRASRELKEEQRLESLRQKAEEEEGMEVESVMKIGNEE